MIDLYQRSLEIILQNQDSSGAYIASPNFETYHYSWFRDGAFIAYAMDRAGEHHSSRQFHLWVAKVINQRAELITRAVSKARAGEELERNDILETRYALDGSDGQEDWPNFQLDGFGTWLWALGQHARLSSQPIPEACQVAADLVAIYLSALWQRPCYDCWEEFPDKVHVHTLAAVHGGLLAYAQLRDKEAVPALSKIQEFIREQGIRDGHYVKYIGEEVVDASLLGLAVPYQVANPNEATMMATVALIESTLREGGGVHRYPADTYYGGGQWLLLTAWLGWYYVKLGQLDRAKMALKWVEEQADETGNMPEQAPGSLNDPAFYQPWRERWGEIASPLLWSHAMYMILVLALKEADR
jgi:GH15 family glucan-1,4-alpha-glucosidase